MTTFKLYFSNQLQDSDEEESNREKTQNFSSFENCQCHMSKFNRNPGSSNTCFKQMFYRGLLIS